ncbi:MAG TPA: glycine--tRNA ligase subunit alpha [Clostridia bacterium]|nr:glycine--tRNA ligase subunit alpha [Clostridia bacterium]
MNFEEMVSKLEHFWEDEGCTLLFPYDQEVGAGTLSPYTFLRVLGRKPWKVVYVQPSRRPADGRYGENPNRLYMHHQLQVIVKPPTTDIQDTYLRSLYLLGLKPAEHDIRFVEDNWETPVLGAAGVGWEVWLDGMEVTQFTYFQQAGGREVPVVAVEITYGLERLAMFVQDKKNVYELEWHQGVTYGDLRRQVERENSVYSFEEADIEALVTMFDLCEKESQRMIDRKLITPAYEYLLKCSHTFNVLDARGTVGVSQRMAYLARVRRLAHGCADLYLENENHE